MRASDLNAGLARFFDATPMPMLLSRVDGSLEYVNPALLSLLGYEAHEIHTDDVIITHPDDVVINRRVRSSLQADPFTPVVVEKRYLHKSGRVVHAVLTIVAQPDLTGGVQRFIAQVVDLIEYRQLEQARYEAEQRFQTMFESAPIGMALCDSLTGMIYDANEQYLAIVGCSLAEARGRGWMSMTHPDDLAENLEQIQRLMSGEITSFRMHKRMVRPDHSLVDVQLSCAPINVGDADGKFHHLAMLEDVTEFRSVQQELLNAAMVYQKSSEAMMILDADGTVLAVNAAFTARTGYQEEEICGKTTQVLDSEKHDPEFFRHVWRTIIEAGGWQGEMWTRNRSGVLHPEWVSVSAINDKSGKLYRLVCLSSDMTEKKSAEKLIWQQANFDSLTGLPNRDMLRDRFSQEIRKAQRSGLQVALFNLDLDRFKEVNDSLGHEMGDRLLAEAARRLTRCVRSVDTVARQGGDEFTIVMGELDDVDSVERIARDVLRVMSAPFQLVDEVVYISTSIGVTLYPRDGTDIDALTRNADQAMYAAKLKGRNCFHYYTDTMQQMAQARQQLIADMRQALPDKQLQLYFQPIVSLSTGRVSRVEAFLRWHHPWRGLLCPGEFLVVAEETNLIVDMGSWVFEEALRQLKRLRLSCAADIQVSINTSAVQYRDRSKSLQEWWDYLQHCAIPDGSVSVEVNEELLMSACADVDAKLAALRDAGFQLVLDDFGTGYSALSSLKEYQVDYLKIDRSFVAKLAEDPCEAAMAGAIIAMAHKLDIQVIAEGVETAAQHRLLAEMACDLAQGHWYAEPMPIDAFERWCSACHNSLIRMPVLLE